MTTITWPATRLFMPQHFEIALRSNVLISTSPLTGATQTVELPGARWMCSIVLPGGYSHAEQAAREALLSQVAGQANRVALWHFARPAPRGTMRGSPTLSATAAAGATTLAITTTALATLLIGDMVKVGSQLVQVVTDATADGAGAMSASIRPALRAQVASGSAVAWDRPTGLFLLTQQEVRVPYQPSWGGEISLEFVEVFA